ncbi:sugar transferase [Nostoc sp. 106C]|uniref:sugar transferase n=1 Tax=Nostoc sp. 106C TaxID=1932667 RepID=UPI000A374626|nr:sugar transferase [Nostoc sp. 106C]
MNVKDSQGARFTIYSRFIKPVLDKAVAVIALFIVAPVIIIVAIAIYISMGKPVVFAQKRPGKKGHIFTCYKFRTMTNECDSNGNLLPDNQRITGIGRFLRKTSLDELPQLWSVLKGDMSFVGPRPLLIEYLPYYSEREHKRHLILPGLTGLAQINGRNRLSWDERFQLDIEYVENQSLSLDLYILFKSFWKVLIASDVDVATQIEDFDEYRRKQMQSRLEESFSYDN